MGVDFDLKDFTDFKDSLIKLSQSGNIQAFNKKVVENMASVYVREAKLNTPVGKRSVKFMQHGKIQTKYFDSEHTRQSWSIGKYQLNNQSGKVEVGRFLPWIGQSKGGVMQGGRLKKPWVDGAYMHEKAEKVVNKNAKRIMEITLKKWIEDHGGY